MYILVKKDAYTKLIYSLYLNYIFRNTFLFLNIQALL